MILLDRLMYLEEHNGVTAAVVPLFDPTISPRNCAVVAIKNRPREIINELLTL
jgi:hypothetical protein